MLIFLWLGSEEKLCPIFGRIHTRWDCVIWWKNNQDMFPHMKGGRFARKKLEQTFVILIIKYVLLYESGVNNWNIDKFCPLIKWDGNEICWIHYAKRFITHLLPRSTLKKKWKYLQSYKTLCLLTLNFRIVSHTIMGFGYWCSLVWSLDFGWSNFGIH
jgi:hypothetical protein